jgi:hypothetical protein
MRSLSYGRRLGTAKRAVVIQVGPVNKEYSALGGGRGGRNPHADDLVMLGHSLSEIRNCFAYVSANDVTIMPRCHSFIRVKLKA